MPCQNAKSDIDDLNQWLRANQLVTNISKTVQMNVKSNASNCDFNLY